MRLNNVFESDLMAFVVPKLIILVLLLILVFVLSGCSSLGETEVLNKTGFRGARSAMSTYNNISGRMGYNTRKNNAALVNRTLGNLSNTQYDTSTPFIIQNLQQISP